MSFTFVINSRALAVALSFVCSLAVADEIKAYRVPKQAAQPALPHGHSADDGHNHGPGDGHDHGAMTNPHGARAMPKVSYTAPEGWREAGPGEARIAGFTITGTNGLTANVAITPLPGLAGRETLIVNMWRQQVGLGELNDTEAAQQLSDVDIGSVKGKMFDMAGERSPGKLIRIVTAMEHRGGVSWFYKLQGDDELVTAQKSNFIAFLKSLKIEEAAPSNDLPDGHPPVNTGNASAQATPPPRTAGTPDWTPPAAWKTVAPGAMQAAKFSVPEVNGAKADVTISVFPNSTGGTLANVNRWRNQIGLGPVDESGLANLVKPLKEAGADAVAAELSNGSRQLVGAIVPAGGQWYFYKLLGDAAAVEPQKETFLQFVKGVKH